MKTNALIFRIYLILTMVALVISCQEPQEPYHTKERQTVKVSLGRGPVWSAVVPGQEHIRLYKFEGHDFGAEEFVLLSIPGISSQEIPFSKFIWSFATASGEVYPLEGNGANGISRYNAYIDYDVNVLATINKVLGPGEQYKTIRLIVVLPKENGDPHFPWDLNPDNFDHFLH